jgi:hypothetical protein
MYYKGRILHKQKARSLQKKRANEKKLVLITAINNYCKSACAIKTVHIKIKIFINFATQKTMRWRTEFTSVTGEAH